MSTYSELVKEALDAVKDVHDENLKKIAFQSILDRLLATLEDKSTTKPVTAQQPASLSREIPDNLTEFCTQNRFNSESQPNITLAIAYYLHFHEEGDFNVDDISKAYDEMLIPKPANPTDTINQNIRKGYITKLNRQKESKLVYHITRSGIEFVKNGFLKTAKSGSFTYDAIIR